MKSIKNGIAMIRMAIAKARFFHLSWFKLFRLNDIENFQDPFSRIGFLGIFADSFKQRPYHTPSGNFSSTYRSFALSTSTNSPGARDPSIAGWQTGRSLPG